MFSGCKYLKEILQFTNITHMISLRLYKSWELLLSLPSYIRPSCPLFPSHIFHCFPSQNPNSFFIINSFKLKPRSLMRSQDWNMQFIHTPTFRVWRYKMKTFSWLICKEYNFFSLIMRSKFIGTLQQQSSKENKGKKNQILK